MRASRAGPPIRPRALEPNGPLDLVEPMQQDRHPRPGARPGRRIVLVAWLALGLFAPLAQAEGQFPIKLIGNHVVARCTLKSAAGQMPIHLLVDLSPETALVLHDKTAGALSLGPTEKTIAVTFAGMATGADGPTLGSVSISAVAMPLADQLTAEYAPQLEEIPVGGMIGLGAFAGQVLQIDLPGSSVRFGNSGDAAFSPGPGAIDRGYVPVPQGVRLEGDPTATAADGSPALPEIGLSMRQYEALAEQAVVGRFGVGGPAAKAIPLGSVDVTRYTALRPLNGKLPTGQPELLLGTQFVSHLRVTIDQPASRILLEPVREPASPAAEQAALLALRDNDLAALEAYLKDREPTSRPVAASSPAARPQAPAVRPRAPRVAPSRVAPSRVAPSQASTGPEAPRAAGAGDRGTQNAPTWLWAEVSKRVLERRLADASSPIGALDDALRFYALGIRESARSRAMVGMADQLLAKKEPRLNGAVATCLALAERDAARDINASAVHEISGRRGLLALQAGDLKQARRHLLSAAFGLPEDPKVRVWLAQLYRQSNQPARAWSQYVEATLAKQPPMDAFFGLAELNRDPSFRATFGAADAELMLEGRVPSYSHPKAREPDVQPAARLIEFFPDANNGKSVAAQLAFRALREHFAGTHAVFIAYHLDPQLSIPLTKQRAERYGAGPGALFADGRLLGDKGGDADDAAGVFGEYLGKLVRPRGAAPRPPAVELAVSAAARQGAIAADVKLAPGPRAESIPEDADLRLRVFLVERCVFAVAANKVPLHYNVVRGEMTPAGGVPIPEGHSENRLTTDLEELARALARAPESGPAIASRIRAGHADVREMQVVAFVQDALTFRVYAAAVAPVDQEQPAAQAQPAPQTQPAEATR